jgi:hypothetical protein
MRETADNLAFPSLAKKKSRKRDWLEWKNNPDIP